LSPGSTTDFGIDPRSMTKLRCRRPDTVVAMDVEPGMNARGTLLEERRSVDATG